MRRSPPRIGRARRGISLVELLVVVGIIGVLLALLLPAIQKVREAAQQVECANHLRQLGFALHLHVQDHGVLPSNGGWDGKQTIQDISGNQFTPATTDLHAGNTWRWGVGQIGLPPREQTGSWLYAVLPYLEKQAQMQEGSKDRPYRLFHCPSRRRAQSWLAYDDEHGAYQTGGHAWAKTDYAANGHVIPNRPRCVALAELRDGLSHTILLGEKALDGHNLERETWYWDEPYFIGGSGGTMRRGLVVLPDRVAVYPYFLDAWGAAHPGKVQFLFADQSVRPLPYWVKFSIMQALLTPAGAEPEGDWISF